MSACTATERLTARLRDGRTLCYAQYGSPEGSVIVNAHGGLACRLDVAAADAAARAAGVRLISPDRPGIGGSDAMAGRTLLDWVDDVSQLMDELRVERFAAMGWSMGGPYAAALGWALAPRVRRIAIIAGAVPLTEPGAIAELPSFDRIYTKLAQRAPWLARPVLRATGVAARLAPRWYGRFAASQLGPADATVLRDEGYDAFGRMSAEALRRPDGVLEDYRAWAKPWGFAPEDVTLPVDVWGGEQDQLLNRGWPAELARRMPNATLRWRQGGHFMAHLHYQEIFAELLRAPG